MVRRRRLEQTVNGARIPESVLVFYSADWPGASEYQRWMAWDTASKEWASRNLPKGVDDLPDMLTRAASTPDQPWDEVKDTI